MARTHVGMLLFPKLTQLDLTGPHELLVRVPDVEVHLVWKSTAPLRADSGLVLAASTTFDACPPLDVLFVPGGPGQIAATADDGVRAWVREQGERAAWVTGACTGALLLGAVGLLRGYRATTHWAYRDLLPLVGATPGEGRVVVDRNRITAGGVTAGLDFGLTLAAKLAGAMCAQQIQLELEYDPLPPFRSGHPDVAGPELVAAVRAKNAPRYREREAQLRALATA
ncbi:MAG: DJ-1/PfpI family protein [Labilithrix sp.]|nr:DJ-1/PfpI family protein [Labilithrix sp.]MCW5816968.1 DJ-1/PfpI family protein [Labilithrix sp.]